MMSSIDIVETKETRWHGMTCKHCGDLIDGTSAGYMRSCSMQCSLNDDDGLDCISIIEINWNEE